MLISGIKTVHTLQSPADATSGPRIRNGATFVQHAVLTATPNRLGPTMIE
jgi:hypothetical protein